jgi:hypothetical protein
VAEAIECYECGAALTYGMFEAFQIDADRILCLDCASRRGGSYDVAERRWHVTPELEDLLRSPA